MIVLLASASLLALDESCNVACMGRTDVLDDSPARIFLSYRREDAAPYARLLQYQLRERLPGARVFMDLDSIEPGLDFAEVIEEAVDSCAVLVALIGRQWVTLTDEQGQRRIDDPSDFVRYEVQAALERGVRVIPVLVDGATPLRQAQLPAELQKLARLNALELSYGRYQYDADRLVELIQKVLAAAPKTAAAPMASQPQDIQPGRAAATEAAKQDPEAAAQKERARAARVLADAERIAQSITSQGWKAEALATVAKEVAATDPARAARLAADADRSARLALNSLVFIAVAEALATVDPARAERIAESITDEAGKAPRSQGLEVDRVGQQFAKPGTVLGCESPHKALTCSNHRLSPTMIVISG